ncbi:MAG: NAD(P)-dependent steroid dehydrogenase, partial [uncultured Chloroflexia bacterium]
GVRRLVHVSTEAVLVDGSALVDVDEARPIPRFPLGPYARTKALAEQVVLRAKSQACATIIVRPRFVWGAGDTSLLPQLVHAARTGRFAWIDHGRYLTSTCHVENLCEGLWCAAQRGRGGNCYFVTDGAPVQLRSFGEALLRTQGIELSQRSVPRRAAMIAGTTMELLWRSLSLAENPPVTRAMVAAMGCEVTLNDSKARRELGYSGRMTVEHGLQAMQRI